MGKFAYETRSQAIRQPENKPKPPIDESSSNFAELELLRGELRSRSDELRNTTVKETSSHKFPSSIESGAEYTAMINIDDRKTVHLGADKKEGSLLAAANPRGMEISHKDERYGFSSTSSGISVTSVLPTEREEFTLCTKAADNSKKRSFTETASKDSALCRCSDGAIGDAVQELYSKKDERTDSFIKEMSGASPREDTALNNLSSLAGAVRQKSSAARRSVEKETRKIINSITVRGVPGDDFFDFLRKRRDEVEEDTVDNFNDRKTEGITHEEDC